MCNENYQKIFTFCFSLTEALHVTTIGLQGRQQIFWDTSKSFKSLLDDQWSMQLKATHKIHATHPTQHTQLNSHNSRNSTHRTQLKNSIHTNARAHLRPLDVIASGALSVYKSASAAANLSLFSLACWHWIGGPFPFLLMVVHKKLAVKVTNIV